MVLEISAFSNANWAFIIDVWKSVTTYCVFVRNNLVSWSSTKQIAVARSSTETEYRALAHSSSQIVWLQQLFDELRMKSPHKPILWCDNINARALAGNPVFHARTKHIKIDVHFLRDQVLNGALEVRYVPITNQLVDCLTKPLTHS